MFVHTKKRIATHNQLSKLCFDSSVGLKEWDKQGKDKKTRACFEFAVGRVSWGRKSCVLYVEIDNRVKIEESWENNNYKTLSLFHYMRRFSIVAEFSVFVSTSLESSRGRMTFNDSHCHNIQFNWCFRYVNFFSALLSRRRFIHNTQKLSSFPCPTSPPSVVNDPRVYMRVLEERRPRWQHR